MVSVSVRATVRVRFMAWAKFSVRVRARIQIGLR